MPKSIRTLPVINYDTSAGKRLISGMEKSRRARDAEVTAKVESIIEDVREEGDAALIRYSEKFDNVRLTPSNLRIGREEIDEAASEIPRQLKEAVLASQKRIEAYHRKQQQKGFTLKTKEGTLKQLIVPLKRVGIYIPGGYTVYPSTVLMNAIPAKVAGVEEIVAITPPRHKLDPAIAFAIRLLGIDEVYRIGGAHGIAALAYGTKQIPAVDKIVGPGNAYVQTAKRLLYGTVDIDSVAGPSEVVILADGSAPAQWVALDLLAQAEHGSGDELAWCITENISYARKVAAAVQKEISTSPVKQSIGKLPGYSMAVIVTPSRRESIELINRIAPEHLQIMTAEPHRDLALIRNASAVFLGKFTPVALGDYFIGTNHVLPTGGAARFASPLGVDSFVKRISVAEATAVGLEHAAPFVSVFARAEKFIHHALSVERRC